MKSIKRIDSNDDGIDDVAITGDFFRLERMDDNSFWVCIYRGVGKKRTAFSIGSKTKITVSLIEDSING